MTRDELIQKAREFEARHFIPDTYEKLATFALTAIAEDRAEIAAELRKIERDSDYGILRIVLKNYIAKLEAAPTDGEKYCSYCGAKQSDLAPYPDTPECRSRPDRFHLWITAPTVEAHKAAAPPPQAEGQGEEGKDESN